MLCFCEYMIRMENKTDTKIIHLSTLKWRIHVRIKTDCRRNQKAGSNLRTENTYSISAHATYINQKLRGATTLQEGSDCERRSQQLLIINIYQIDTPYTYISYSLHSVQLSCQFYRHILSGNYIQFSCVPPSLFSYHKINNRIALECIKIFTQTK